MKKCSVQGYIVHILIQVSLFFIDIGKILVSTVPIYFVAAGILIGIWITPMMIVYDEGHAGFYRFVLPMVLGMMGILFYIAYIGMRENYRDYIRRCIEEEKKNRETSKVI